MRKVTIDLPVITIDNSLVKSTAERNQGKKSKIGEMFGVKTPNVTDVTPLEVPEFTPTEGPWVALREEGEEFFIDKEGNPIWPNNPEKTAYFKSWKQEAKKYEPPADPTVQQSDEQLRLRAFADWSAGIDYDTPLEQLIQPKTDIIQDPVQIESWIRRNIHLLARPSQYCGGEQNTSSPDLYEPADVRVLVVRLSPYDSVNGSLTHGALAQLCRKAAREGNWNVYVDFSYMPSLSKDAEIFRERKMPYMFGRNTKRPLKDFDIIMFSQALTMEAHNIIPVLVYSGIAPFQDMRHPELLLNSPERHPIILLGGVVADFTEILYGKVGEHECVPDATVVGDGEFTVLKVLQQLYESKKAGHTKNEFLRLCHDLSEEKHFERNEGDNRHFSWFYQPRLYSTVYSDTPDPKTGYKELIAIERKPGYEYAAKPGQIKRAVMRDLNECDVHVEIPILYDGSLGNSSDIQLSSGCWTGDVRILTDTGYHRIEDLQDSTNLTLLTEFGPRRCEGVRYQGLKETTLIRTLQKSELRVSTDHRFKVMSPDGVIDWKHAREISIGDQLLFRRGDGELIPESRGLDPEFCYLAGLIYGDGSMSVRGSFALIVPEKEIETKDRANQILRDNKINVGWSLIYPKDDDGVMRTQLCWVGQFYSKKLVGFFPPYQKGGFWKQEFPYTLWNSGKQQIASFLAGLATTDGCVGPGGEIRWSTKHKGMAQEIKRATMLLGIWCSWDYRLRENPLNGKPMEEYCVRTLGQESHCKAQQLIKFGLSHKEEKRAEIIAAKTRKVEKVIGYPYGAKDMVSSTYPKNPKASFHDRPGRTYREAIMRIKRGNHDFLAASLMQRMWERDQLREVSQLDTRIKDFLQHEWCFEEVISNEPTGQMEPVYDPVNVQGTSSYVAEGVVNHNCLCVHGDTLIETDMGFETIKDAYERLQDPDEVGGVMVQTRQGLQSAEKIVFAGKKKVREYTFRDGDGVHEYKLVATEDHKVDTGIEGDAERDWQRLGDIQIGQEVWVVDPELYNKAQRPPLFEHITPFPINS